MNLKLPDEGTDRRYYYCVWSRATSYFLGAGMGMGFAALILIPMDLPGSTKNLVVFSTMVAFFLLAIWMNKLKRGEPVTEERIEIDELMV